MRKIIGQITSFIGVLAVSGCVWVDPTKGFLLGPSPPGFLAMTSNLEIMSLVATKKTLGDHVASWITGQDCSVVRVERDRGGAWCVDWPGAPPPPEQLYCYASLARPSCYNQPYNEGNDRLIGFIPASAPRRN